MALDERPLQLYINSGESMASDNIEELAAFFPIDTVGLCPPETILVPVVGIILVLVTGKIFLKAFNPLS